MTAIYESTVARAWPQTLDDGTTVPCFTLDEVSEHAFIGASDWLPRLDEAILSRSRVRVMCSVPEVTACDDPLCGDGCCDDPDCTNVPEEERQMSFVLRADTIEWL